MGASVSKIINSNEQRGGAKKYTNDKSSLDFVVAYYILSMNIESLKSTRNESQCEHLSSLTTQAITNEVRDQDILDKYEKIRGPIDLAKSDDKCKALSDYYIKIGKIFASIVMAINPEYEYTDENGETHTKNVETKQDIPFGEEFSLSKLSFCGSRINSLTERNGENSICVADAHKLQDQLGIPELYDLYCDSDYDEESGQFLGIQSDTKKQYTKDLRLFYRTFTGKEQVPESIKRFGDIPLNSYSKKSVCKNPVIQQGGNSSVDTSSTNGLLESYAENLRRMIVRVNERQLKLIDILNSLFTYDKINPDMRRMVRIRENLTFSQLQKIHMETKRLVADLYLSCEEDYLKGIHIYEAIIEKKILETTISQYNFLEKLHEIIKHEGK